MLENEVLMRRLMIVSDILRRRRRQSELVSWARALMLIFLDHNLLAERHDIFRLKHIDGHETLIG